MPELMSVHTAAAISDWLIGGPGRGITLERDMISEGYFVELYWRDMEGNRHLEVVVSGPSQLAAVDTAFQALKEREDDAY